MHTTYLLKRYIVVAAITMIGLAALSIALVAFADISLGSAVGIVAAIVPALDAGQTYGKRWEARPKNAYAWKLTAAFAILNFLVSAGLAATMVAISGELSDIAVMVNSIGTHYLALIIAVLFVIYWAVSRYFFGYGAKLSVRALESKSDQNQP